MTLAERENTLLNLCLGVERGRLRYQHLRENRDQIQGVHLPYTVTNNTVREARELLVDRMTDLAIAEDKAWKLLITEAAKEIEEEIELAVRIAVN